MAAGAEGRPIALCFSPIERSGGGRRHGAASQPRLSPPVHHEAAEEWAIVVRWDFVAGVLMALCAVGRCAQVMTFRRGFLRDPVGTVSKDVPELTWRDDPLLGLTEGGGTVGGRLAYSKPAVALLRFPHMLLLVDFHSIGVVRHRTLRFAVVRVGECLEITTSVPRTLFIRDGMYRSRHLDAEVRDLQSCGWEVVSRP